MITLEECSGFSCTLGSGVRFSASFVNFGLIFVAGTSWQLFWRYPKICWAGIFHFHPFLSSNLLWVMIWVFCAACKYTSSGVTVGFVIYFCLKFTVSDNCLWYLFLCCIHCRSDSARWMFPGTTHLWSGITTIIYGWSFCEFGWRTPMVPLPWNWNHVVCWGMHTMILLVSRLTAVVGLLEFMFLVWACSSGLVVTSCPIHIEHTWSILWKFVPLYLINFCWALLIEINNIFSIPFYLFFVDIWYLIIEDISLCLDAILIYYD